MGQGERADESGACPERLRRAATFDQFICRELTVREFSGLTACHRAELCRRWARVQMYAQRAQADKRRFDLEMAACAPLPVLCSFSLG